MTGTEQNPEPRAVGLGREVERIARRQADLDRRHGELDALVRQLAEDLAVLIPPPDDDQPGALASWLAVDDPQRAQALLADLADWLARVYLQYPDAVLPSCWAWHPAVAEELWWLRQAHRAAFEGRGACWREVGDWHDRQRPGVVRRLRSVATGCELALHTPGGRQDTAPPTVPLAAATDAIANAWTTSRGAPTPTGDQLAEAQRHDDDSHGRHR